MHKLKKTLLDFLYQAIAHHQGHQKFLGHLFGSKDVSREVASHAAGSTGLDEGLMKKMLPVVASLVMGSMSKQATAGGASGADGSVGGLLGQLLDRDGDGAVMDDIMDMAGRFLR